MDLIPHSPAYVRGKITNVKPMRVQCPVPLLDMPFQFIWRLESMFGEWSLTLTMKSAQECDVCLTFLASTPTGT